MIRDRCECADSSCPVVHSVPCEAIDDLVRLFRIDMEDETGTLLCGGCSDDAMESGLFTKDG